MFKNKAKEKLLAGKVAWGVMLADPSPDIIEILGNAGFDWVLLDNEHGHVSMESMANCARACEVSGMAPIVRPIVGTPEIIRPFMDMGAFGVQAPQVDTPEAAKIVVDAVKYPPLGLRGFFSGNRNNLYGAGMPAAEYLEHANQESLVVIMVETPTGIRNAEAIARVEGVDVVFEHIGFATWEKSQRILSKGGRIVTCGATTGPDVNINLAHLFMKQHTILGSTMASIPAFKEVMDKIENGKYIPMVDKVIPMEDIRDAHEYLQNRQHKLSHLPK